MNAAMTLEITAYLLYCGLWGAFCGLFLAHDLKLPTWAWLSAAAVGGYFIPDIVKWTLGGAV